MFHVYILYSKKDNGLYIGYTANIKNRLKAHNEGSVISTKGRRPLSLIFLESYINKGDATRREKYLKTTIGRKMLKTMLRNTLGENIIKKQTMSLSLLLKWLI
ncbi:GIY-YIG nuclease family protein [Candidatus Peregrinibacteria bacterium]|jgi:putative endonuclease|nr:GIY-YIG nuclease family protein [Candidatus Peregrinibacteria bacterium]MBT3599104.1 GIY-YIG nuclease family protein [Candidatus Peregrinibacteria bacterium]MBT4367661.1 GIY-YIG nuclease family protein [Candidatus Peregrinibacteria bacterium]MBT4585439.1 GIY-YIG nuclease family protein [Candidatus Peregrinibacteria bacterium]MBT6730410.1 GIY-YIG nuclease family protein [Candidatus Peregrinibacteria bacterium]